MPAAARKSKPKVNKSTTEKTTVREAVPQNAPSRPAAKPKTAPATRTTKVTTIKAKSESKPLTTKPAKAAPVKRQSANTKTASRPAQKAAENLAPVSVAKKTAVKKTSVRSTKETTTPKEKAVVVASTRAARRAEVPEGIAKPKTAPGRKKQARRKKVATAVREAQNTSKPISSRSRQKTETATVHAAKPTVSKRAAKPTPAPQLTLTMPVGTKAKRTRVPKDLATQYGEKEKHRVQPESAATKRARRDAALRQKMRDAMEVDDNLVARLRRAGMIGGEIEETNGNGHASHSVRTKSAPRRPRKWEARCGKCGVKTLFKTQAGLCARCGAIMVRE